MKTLNELFDKPLKWKLRSKSIYDWHYEFYVGGDRFAVDIEMTDETNDYWNIDFRNTSSPNPFGLTGEGNEIQVFSTVVDIMKDFIKKKKPTSFEFSAKEKSRVKLYDRMVRKMTKGYKMNIENEGGDKTYVFHRK